MTAVRVRASRRRTPAAPARDPGWSVRDVPSGGAPAGADAVMLP
ncbi:hypothetical protein [Streptomyces neyagawaensis]|uniref:Uncharacterized protein n=1 Tax=Streptomyces neyagawaensis TaxID=42238 RepID=A0ABV3BCB3_9ACTN